MNMFFIGKYDGIGIEEYIKEMNYSWKKIWKICLSVYLTRDATIWWSFLNHDKMKAL
jgi:hypothetical protein